MTTSCILTEEPEIILRKYLRGNTADQPDWILLIIDPYAKDADQRSLQQRAFGSRHTASTYHGLQFQLINRIIFPFKNL